MLRKIVALVLVLTMLFVSSSLASAMPKGYEMAVMADVLKPYIAEYMKPMIEEVSAAKTISKMDAEILVRSYIALMALNDIKFMGNLSLLGNDAFTEVIDKYLNGTDLLTSDAINLKNAYFEGGNWDDTMGKAISVMTIHVDGIINGEY